jgi:membrane protease YdiL (CAAX protease family)
LFAGLIVLAQACLAAAAVIDSQLLGRTGFTPLQFAAGSASLALLIPYSMWLQRWLYGVPARSLHSVTGSFRFGVFGRALVIFGPLVLIVMSAGFFVPDDRISWSTADLIAFFIIGMTLTPLAAAGEEYGVRGLMRSPRHHAYDRPLLALPRQPRSLHPWLLYRALRRNGDHHLEDGRP